MPGPEPIFHDVERFIREHMPHRHYHQASNPPQEASVSLLQTIEADLASVGHHLDQAAHDVLTKHLGLANIAAHVANETAVLANSPLAKVVETAAGLNPAEQAWVARAASEAAAWLDALSAPAAVAAPAVDVAQPVEPVAAQ